MKAIFIEFKLNLIISLAFKIITQARHTDSVGSLFFSTSVSFPGDFVSFHFIMEGKSRSASSKLCATSFIDEEYFFTFYGQKRAAVFGSFS